MKTLSLPSGRQLVYELVEPSKQESILIIVFTSLTDISIISAVFNDKTDTSAFLLDIADNINTYLGYNVFDSLSVSKAGVYTVKLEKETLLSKIEELQAEKSQLSTQIEKQANEIEQLQSVIIDLTTKMAELQ